MSALSLIGRTVQAPGRRRLGIVVDAWPIGRRPGDYTVVVRWEPLSEFETSTLPWAPLAEVRP